MNDFDLKAKDWDMNPLHIERSKAIADLMIKQLPLANALKALEFGAGTGLLSFYLKEHFREIFLMDSSEEMLKKAQQKLEGGDHAKFRTLFIDLEREDYHGDPFDIIYTQMVLHHIRDINGIIGKFNKLLTANGILAIADLYTEDGSFHDGDMNLHHGFDPEKLATVLVEQGFHDCKTETCFVIRKEITPGNIKEYPVFLLTAKKLL
jgi:tRNA (cmo5U34)-methyltransferase